MSRRYRFCSTRKSCEIQLELLDSSSPPAFLPNLLASVRVRETHTLLSLSGSVRSGSRFRSFERARACLLLLPQSHSVRSTRSYFGVGFLVCYSSPATTHASARTRLVRFGSVLRRRVTYPAHRVWLLAERREERRGRFLFFRARAFSLPLCVPEKGRPSWPQRFESCRPRSKAAEGFCSCLGKKKVGVQNQRSWK